MNRLRRSRLLPALLILAVLGCGAATLAALSESFEERRSGVAAADLRLAVLLVAQVQDAQVLEPDERALFANAMALLTGDVGDVETALQPLAPEQRTEARDEISKLVDHGQLAARGAMAHDSGHSVASHHDVQDLLRIASVTAATDASSAERTAVVFSAGLLASLTALFALLVRSRVSSDVHRSAAKRFGTLLDQSPDATAVIGKGGKISYASAAMHDLLGAPLTRRSELLEFACPGYRDALDAHLRSDGGSVLCIASLHNPADTAGEREFDVRVVNLSQDPVVQGRLVTIAERTVENRARRQLEHLAGHDQLTGLPNRRSLMAAVDSAAPSALLMIDLDGFKKTNDTLGHGAGDELLVAISRRFEAALPDGAALYRLGGDEFAVLFDGAAEEARNLATRLLACLDEPIELSMAYERASASIGVAYRDAGDVSIPLLRQADIALYDAKRGGGDRLRILDPELQNRSVEASDLTRSFQHAVFDDEFRLVYQPIVDARTERTMMVEALARWTSPAHGVVRPDQFIPLAESSGRIVELGTWVLDRALQDLAAWRRDGLSPDVGISINVSPYQLTSDTFPGLVAERLRHYRIQPSLVTLEVTESAVVADDERILARLAELREVGCSVACDDFGSGYSNLGQLMKLPLNLIKIDRKLLTTLDRMREASGTTEQPCQVMSAIVSIGEAMQAKIVAEGVETPMQSTSIRNSGVQLMQGYLFSRPVEAEEVLALLGEIAVPSLA